MPAKLRGWRVLSCSLGFFETGSEEIRALRTGAVSNGNACLEVATMHSPIRLYFGSDQFQAGMTCYFGRSEISLSPSGLTQFRVFRIVQGGIQLVEKRQPLRGIKLARFRTAIGASQTAGEQVADVLRFLRQLFFNKRLQLVYSEHS